MSQFTLYANVKRGSKPDFHLALKSDESKKFYLDFLELLRKSYKPEKIQDGEFGALMDVEIHNDGPVTIIVDSPPSSIGEPSAKDQRRMAYSNVEKQKDTSAN